AIGVIGSLIALQTYITYNAVQDAKLKQTIIDHLQTKMIAVTQYINALKSLAAIIKRNPILAQVEEFKMLELLINSDSMLSADCKKLLQLLDSKTFQGEPAFFSLAGR